MGYVQATNKLEDDFSAGATHMVLIDKNVSSKAVRSMVKEMKEVDGVSFALGLDSVIGSRIPDEMIPDEAKDTLESENWKLLLVQSNYSTATDEVNNQIEELKTILKKYDDTGMLIGEAPCTKDLNRDYGSRFSGSKCDFYCSNFPDYCNCAEKLFPSSDTRCSD